MVEINAEMAEAMRVTLSDGRHTWWADEPEERGGDDTGPSPYELLLGSLAACTLVTLQLYCRHKSIQLDSVAARYRHEKIPAEETGVEGGPKGMVDRITSRVTIRGQFDDAQRERLAQIVSRCPVHRTLKTGVFDMADEVEFE
jgi:putative redox protein